MPIPRTPVLAVSFPVSADVVQPLDEGSLNVRNFGARGDGVTDDSDAFAAALKRLPATGGTIVVPDAPCYFLGSTLQVNKPCKFLIGATVILGPVDGSIFRLWTPTSAQGNVSFIGSGRGVTTILINPAAEPGGDKLSNAFELSENGKTDSQFPSSDRVYIGHMTIDGNKANVPAPEGEGDDDLVHNGIASSASRWSTFEDLEVKNFWFGGIGLGLWPQFNSLRDIFTTNNGYSAEVGYGGILIQGSAVGNTLDGHVSDGDVGGLWVKSNCYGNTFKGTYRNCVVAVTYQEPSPNVGRNNIFDFTVEGATGNAVIVSGNVTHCQFRGTIDDGGEHGLVATEGVNNCRFDVVVRRCQTMGMELRGDCNYVTGIFCENSQAEALAHAGFAIAGAAKGNRADVLCIDNQATKTQRGVGLYDTCSFNQVNAHLFGTSHQGVIQIGTTVKNTVRYTDANGADSVGLAGTITIADAATTGALTFPSAEEPDGNYKVSVTPVADSGTPDAGSNRVKKVTKATTGVTVQLEAAPGSGKSVTFDIFIFR